MSVLLPHPPEHGADDEARDVGRPRAGAEPGVVAQLEGEAVVDARAPEDQDHPRARSQPLELSELNAKIAATLPATLFAATISALLSLGRLPWWPSAFVGSLLTLMLMQLFGMAAMLGGQQRDDRAALAVPPLGQDDPVILPVHVSTAQERF